MKFRSLTLIAFLSILFACNNELEVNADWQDVTVIYGILDPTADTNYIRVQRGYLGTEPARNSYGNPDSIYYDTSAIEVILNWYAINNNSSRGELQGSVELPVDFSKNLNDNGPFTTEDFRLYRVPAAVPIQNQYEYEVRVIKNNGTPDAYASTRLVTPFDIQQPLPTGNPPRYRGFLHWENVPFSNIMVFQPYFYFYYKEFDINTKESEIKVIEYKYKTVDKKTEKTDYKLTLSDDEFFSYIANRIPDDPNKLRFFERMDFNIWGTDEVLNTYMNLQTPSEGINQNRPDYTNVTNGIGIFSSRIKIELNGAVLNESGGTNSLDVQLYLKNVMCSKRFTTIRLGDTCICNKVGGAISVKCPYDL